MKIPRRKARAPNFRVGNVRSIPYIALIVALLLLCGHGQASQQAITAAIGFDLPITVDKNNDISFGLVKAKQSGNYIITPTGDVSVSDGGVWVGGSAQASNMIITGSTTQEVDITVQNYVADSGVTPSDAMCIYDEGTAAACALTNQEPPGTGTILRIGVTVTVDGTQEAGTSAAPSFDVVVTNH